MSFIDICFPTDAFPFLLHHFHKNGRMCSEQQADLLGHLFFIKQSLSKRRMLKL